MTTTFRHLAIAVALGASAACAVNPATGERELMLVSQGQEIQMGREADPSVIATYGLYPDSAIQSYVRALGARLAAKSERPDLPWTFRVVDDPIVNAFALPGGYVYVTRGIMAYFDSEAELVSVLGHEIGHVTARHSARQMTQQQLGQVGLIAGAILVPKAQDLILGIGGAGLQVLFLKFSRDDERQADLLGLRYMSGVGYDPHEMPEVFAMLGRVSQASGGGRLPTWLSTHPDPEDRRQRIEAAIQALPAGNGSTVNRNEYLRRLDGLMYGVNPREGFFREQAFFHPDLAFRMDFPSGWATANQKQGVVAQSPSKDAMLQLTLSDVTSVDDCAATVVRREGVAGGTVRSRSVNGLDAASAPFRITQDQQVVDGDVTCIAYGGGVYQLVGVGTSQSWPTHRATVDRAVQSFARLTDRAALGVQPLRLDIVTLDRAMTLRQFAQRYPSQVPIEELALINGLGPDDSIAARTAVKRVVGGPLP
jgi:predicted Zn-dependent protease